MRKIIEDCQSRGIDVILTYLPFISSEGQLMEANFCYDLSDEYGVNYINFNDVGLIDNMTDWYDGDDHLNPSGARKVTDYLGNYIKEHYDIDDQRYNNAYSDWNTDFIVIKDGGNQAAVINDIRESGKSVDTSFGYIQYYCDDAGNYGLYLDGEELVTGNTDDELSVLIRVKRNDETFDRAEFEYAYNRLN